MNKQAYYCSAYEGYGYVPAWRLRTPSLFALLATRTSVKIGTHFRLYFPALIYLSKYIPCRHFRNNKQIEYFQYFELKRNSEINNTLLCDINDSWLELPSTPRDSMDEHKRRPNWYRHLSSSAPFVGSNSSRDFTATLVIARELEYIGWHIGKGMRWDLELCSDFVLGQILERKI